ncbi:MAG: LacI family DNA-binding transcriptional regulator [Isosphaeraceae bacterium]
MPTPSLPKYLDIARAIESEIVGRDSAKVPSSRQVASAYGVSVVTASRAIQVLKDRGLIRTVDRSGSFLTPPAPTAEGRECYALAQRSTPGPWFQASLSFSHAGFAAVARQEGVRFEVDRFRFDESTRPAEFHRQARRAAEAGVSGVVFMPSRHQAEAAAQDEVFLRSCREAGLAIVLIERNLRGLARPLEYDLVAADDFDGGLRCTHHLLDQGRRRIAFLTGSPTSSHEGRLAGYLAALLHAQTGWGPVVLEQPSGLATKKSYGELADQILMHGADGVVCYQDYTALGLILELLSRGVRVPGDVAITGFDNLPIGKAYSIGVTTYAFSAEAVARHATRLIRSRVSGDSGPPVKVLIPGELIVRESSRAAESSEG